MNKLMGIQEALSLLRNLRETISEFAAWEERLNSELRARTTAEERAYAAATSEQTARTAEAIAEAETTFLAGKQRCNDRYEARKRRISEGHMASRNRAMEAIRQQEGRRKYKVQEGTLNAERRRDSELTSATANHQAFHLKLAENREAFLGLEAAAHNAFLGYANFRKFLSPERRGADPEASLDENQLFEQLIQLQTRCGETLGRFQKIWLLRALRLFPIWLLVLGLLSGCVVIFVAPRFLGNVGLPWQQVGISLAALSIILAAVRTFAINGAQPLAAALGDELAKARRLHEVCFEKAEAHFRQEQERIKGEFESTVRRLDQEWKQAVKEAIDLLDVRPRQIDEQAQRVTQRNEQLHPAQLQRLEREHESRIAQLQRDGEARAKELSENHTANLAKLNAEHQARWQQLEQEWKQRVGPACAAIRACAAAASSIFPDWQDQRWKTWTPPQEFKNGAKFGRLDVNVSELVEAVPKDKRLALPESVFAVPLLLTYPQTGSILFETTHTGAEEAMTAINNIIFRLLSATPPGKLSFTIFDPVGLGQNFAGLMHLADYEESHINSRIWTQTVQLEEKLAELNEHMEKVIQMYLRNEYETIAEYNAQAGVIAEKYHFLVVADFPVNFSDTAARRLINIATSGARCGVYTLIHWDRRHAVPPGFVPEELRKNSVCIVHAGNDFKLANDQPAGTHLVLDTPPSPEFATGFLHNVGESGKDSNRVEVPFDQVAPKPDKIWSAETTDELRVPIGRSGATKLQLLEIGKATRQHALIAGKTGSGKSTLFHVIITNLALWCSPEQVEFYLVDFKKGVEFKCYSTRKLPHARVVAIESDREFGLSVLERVDAELRRRGDLFRQLGVQDLAGYKRAGGTEPMPRSLLLIDEFQEYFVEEDRVSQGAAVLLDRIVRQGRAFGIHVLLGSQTLGGAYTLARATIGQMVIRIALQCNEADAYLIMDQDNPAPRLLSRPGEGIYNDAAGSIEGNSPFQAVWLPEALRDNCLAQIRERANQSGKSYPGPFVFEGNAPADVRDNTVLGETLRAGADTKPALARVWLGAPNSIKGPTEAVFQKQSGSNLLIVGQSEEPAVILLAVALVSLASQYPKGAVRFRVLDSTPPGFPQRDFLERVIHTVPHEIVPVKNSELAETMTGLAEELQRRAADEQASQAPDIFVLIHGLQNYKKLRQEDEFGFSSSADEGTAQPAAVLQNLINEGPGRGIHIIATFDTYNNVNRFLGRKALSEFEMRVLFQMSASDSASLIDEPDASTLGLHRALYYNDREGYTETFRPYALPGNEWIEEIAEQLGRRVSQRPL